jgi:hypothetical protein
MSSDVATLWVRYKNGDTDSWRLTDELAVEINDFVVKLISTSARNEVFSFPVLDEEGGPGTDFGYVSLRLTEVAAWHLDGLVNKAAAAALWAEMQGPDHSE